MIELTKEELMFCSQERLIELVLRYQKMWIELSEKVEELCEELGI